MNWFNAFIICLIGVGLTYAIAAFLHMLFGRREEDTPHEAILITSFIAWIIIFSRLI